MGVFSNAQGQLTPQSVRDIMAVLHTCKIEEDPIKNEDASANKIIWRFFSDAKGQLTPKSAVEFCRNSNSSKLL